VITSRSFRVVVPVRKSAPGATGFIGSGVKVCISLFPSKGS